MGKRGALWRTLSFGKMKITQEEFDKLKQLDRIEYRQKEEKIKSWMRLSLGLNSGKALCVILVFSILVLPQVYTAFGIDVAISILEFSSFFIGLFIPFFVFGLLIDSFLFGMRLRKLKNLEEEYFTFKTEVKK